MQLRILPDHQKLLCKKYIFYWLEWLKTFFDAFAHTPRPPETFFQKRYILLSGVVKNVFWCICAYFQTTRNFFFKKDIFERLECLKTCLHAFAHISRPPETFLQKWFFWPSGVLKNVFWCICAYFQTTSNFFSIKIFLPSGVVKNVFWCMCTCFQTTSNFFSKKIFVTVWSG